jgi:hypothetical protein
MQLSRRKNFSSTVLISINEGMWIKLAKDKQEKKYIIFTNIDMNGTSHKKKWKSKKGLDSESYVNF